MVEFKPSLSLYSVILVEFQRNYSYYKEVKERAVYSFEITIVPEIFCQKRNSDFTPNKREWNLS